MAAPKGAVPDEKRDAILIFDFGGQYCHLIARNVRENGVYSEIVGFKTGAKEIAAMSERFNVKGIILSGGPDSVYEKDAPSIDRSIFGLNLPILGLCYGHQLIAYLNGGKVTRSPLREYGEATVFIDRPSDLLKGLKAKTTVWMSHGDSVSELPPGYEVLAHTGSTPVAAFRHATSPIFGLQWHPEVAQTENGSLVFKNFVIGICGCKPTWKVGNLVEKSIREIRATVKGGKCLIALSGGVDSATAAALVAKAVGKNLIAVYVDTGLMREGETEQIRKTFGKLGAEIRIVDARERFLSALAGVSDPEMKRKVIGNQFIRVFEGIANEAKADFLVQGTIYPDRVESGMAGKSASIKTHHNVGGLPKDIRFKSVIEPLRDLYKDEVRALAERLGLPEHIVRRQPFPGPGLAVRMMGPITEEKLDMVRKADSIVTREIEDSGLSKGLWQYFAVLTDTKAVGVKGDSRAYGSVVAWRALVSRDAMTARFAELPWELVRKISTRIANEVPGVTRVVYDTTDKPPGTVEWE